MILLRAAVLQRNHNETPGVVVVLEDVNLKTFFWHGGPEEGKCFSILTFRVGVGDAYLTS